MLGLSEKLEDFCDCVLMQEILGDTELLMYSSVYQLFCLNFPKSKVGILQLFLDHKVTKLEKSGIAKLQATQ